MIFRDDIYANGKVMIVELEGQYSAEEFLTYYGDLMSKAEFNKIESIIWDASKLKVGHVTINEIYNIIENLKRASEKRKGGKAAWVVSDKLGFGMGRMFEMMSEDIIPIKIKVFEKIDEAKKWIM